MRIYVYVSVRDADILGFTSDETGGNLPEQLGPWDREDDLLGVVVIGTEDDQIAKAIRADGFHIVTDRTVH